MTIPVRRPRRRLGARLLATVLVAGSAGMAWSGGDHDHHHRAAAAAPSEPARRQLEVQLPGVQVQQHDGRRLPFARQFDEDAPVLLNFIYTSCTAICPPMTQIFAATQARLGERAQSLRMISVSIDPENDTAARLADYAGRFGAGPQWRFDTGTQAASAAIQQAFGVYNPDPMSHTPTTFVRPRGSRHWVRLDGFATPERLIQEAFGGS